MEDARAATDAVPVALAVGQAAFFFAYACAVIFWLISEWLNWQNPRSTESYEELQQVAVKGDSSGKGEEATIHTSLSIASGNSLNGPHPSGNLANSGHVDISGKGDAAIEPLLVASPGRARCRPNQGIVGEILASPLVRCLLLDRAAIKAQRLTFRAMAEFGGLMLWYFFCDRTTILGSSGKSYSRDLFVFLFVLLTLVAGMTSLSTVKSPVFLVRQQTEEWKGWMQVLFLLYHYFEAKEAYNAIRIFIAGYVWMTGFGNFIYYYKTGDFSIGRFAQMMWRLNFLVFFACAVLNNSYMLYYICPMHTLFTVMVYACLGIAPHLNQSRPWLIIKMVLCWLSVLVLWHQPVFYAMWKPFAWLVGYMDPRKPADQDIMHEWYFRSSLDRYVWIYGMICGMAQPAMQSALTALDQLPRVTQVSIRSAIVAVCGGVGYVWYTTVYTLPRNDYNQVHPYTSWIPITLWAILRNLTPTLRLHHLRLYGWLGCITLETYICQFHIWMKTSIPDGQPKALLVVIPGYPLLNFTAVTAGYIYVSFRLFELTNALKNAAVPHNNNALLLRNTILMIALGAMIYGVGAVMIHFWVPVIVSD